MFSKSLMNSTETRSGRTSFFIPALDGIRAIAFLTVFVAHNVWQVNDRVPCAGGFGVMIFFFLSGYLITTLLRIEAQARGTIDLGHFYLRRARRILPPLYITLALAYVVGTFHLLSYPGTVGGALSVIFFVFNYASLLTQNPALVPSGIVVVWSLMIEEHFYLLFPCFYKYLCGYRISRKRQMAILLMFCIVPLIDRKSVV